MVREHHLGHYNFLFFILSLLGHYSQNQTKISGNVSYATTIANLFHFIWYIIFWLHSKILSLL